MQAAVARCSNGISQVEKNPDLRIVPFIGLSLQFHALRDPLEPPDSDDGEAAIHTGHMFGEPWTELLGGFFNISRDTRLEQKESERPEKTEKPRDTTRSPATDPSNISLAPHDDGLRRYFDRFQDENRCFACGDPARSLWGKAGISRGLVVFEIGGDEEGDENAGQEAEDRPRNMQLHEFDIDEECLKEAKSEFRNILEKIWVTPIKACSNCRKVPQHASELKACGRCKVPVYCSIDCQRGNWARHRATCDADVAANKSERRTRTWPQQSRE